MTFPKPGLSSDTMTSGFHSTGPQALLPGHGLLPTFKREQNAEGQLETGEMKMNSSQVHGSLNSPWGPRSKSLVWEGRSSLREGGQLGRPGCASRSRWLPGQKLPSLQARPPFPAI